MMPYHKKTWICAIIVIFVQFFYTFSFAQTENIKGVEFKDGSTIQEVKQAPGAEKILQTEVQKIQLAQQNPEIAREVIIPDGAEISVVTTETISSRTAVAGTVLKFEVYEDLIVDSVTVIKEGAIVKGYVVDATRASQIGKKGNLNISIEATSTIDNQPIKLRAVKSQEGKDRIGAVIVSSTFMGPFALLKRGTNAEIRKGTKFQVYTDERKIVHIGDKTSAIKQDLYNELLKLKELKDKGILTEEEFEVQKKKTLAETDQKISEKIQSKAIALPAAGTPKPAIVAIAKPAEPKSATAAINPAVVSSKIVSPDGRFEKFASGVMRDTKTGLDWYAGPDKNTSWDDAKQWTASLRIDGGGWRLPTRTELKGLYQKGAGSRNMTSLLETTGWWVWSGETGVNVGVGGGGGAVDAGWALDFDDGREILDARGKSNNKRGFAVRPTTKSATAAIDPALVSSKIVSPDGRFEKLESGVMRDTKTGLDWYAGPDKNTGWDDAKGWVANLMVDGGGWRMPTLEELKSLYQKGAGPRNMTSLLKTTGWWVWSGETGSGHQQASFYSFGAFCLDFDGGRGLLDRRDNSNYKRGFAVRSRR